MSVRSLKYGSAEWRRWKHQEHWAAATADPLGAGNTALIAALGGNSAVLGFYDTRKGVTLNGSNVSEWDDVRGTSGFGPSLTQASGTHQPAWDAGNTQVTFDGSSTWLNSSAVALFANSGVGLTMVYVGTVPSAAGVLAYAATCFDSASILAGVGVATSAANVICARFRGGTASSTVASSTTRRLVFAAKESGTAGEVEVPTNAQVRVFGTAATSANCQITLGGLFPSGGISISNPLAASIRAVLILAGLYTTAQRDTIKTWATTYHGVTLL